MAYIRQYPAPAQNMSAGCKIAGSHCHAIKNENQKHNVTQYTIASEKALRWKKKQKSKVR